MSKFTERVAAFCERHPVLYKCILLAENAVKKPVFNCQSCGQCVLSQNAFTCCMRCPKQIRNGPCGGTRADGHCEVYPERYCIWWLIHKRSKMLGWQKKLKKYHIPVDRRFHETSAWINMMAGKIEAWSFGNGDEKKPTTKTPDREEGNTHAK
ncbi:MAG TPA: methylenetetrahydrofolate reductase C-terminal domain-containing protein [Armatimonadota bacterium]|jgi:methylenetetrahydrofolate reductase (NADPH)